MKVGILTYCNAYNYGAFLQACCLCARLNSEQDIDAEIIDYSMKKEKENYNLKAWKLRRKIRYFPKYRFLCKLHREFDKIELIDPRIVKSKQTLISDSEDDFELFVSGKYDVIVAGSDEIWKTDGFRGFPTPYWLIGDLKCRKLAYAVSARSDFHKLSEEEIKIIINCLSEFELIGVRDDLTYKSVSEMINRKEKLINCCDPSFLLPFVIKQEQPSDILIGKVNLDLNKKNIVVMTEDKVVAAHIRKSIGDTYNLLSVAEWQKGYKNIGNLNPFDWLKLIANCDLVIASYFHAICFSIVTDTPFIALGTNNKKSKLIDLLEKDEKLYGRLIANDSLYEKSMNWSSIVIKAMIHDDNSNFIQAKRANFDIFLEVLRRGGKV